MPTKLSEIGMSIFISDKIDFKTKVLPEIKGKFCNLHWSFQEGIMIINMEATNDRASKYLRQKFHSKSWRF